MMTDNEDSAVIVPDAERTMHLCQRHNIREQEPHEAVTS